MERERTDVTGVTGKVTAIVLAAGQGKRMQSKIQKQYLLLDGKPLLYYSLKAFEQSSVDEIVLVVSKDMMQYCEREIVAQFGFQKIAKIVEGGKERYHSVYEGLKAASDAEIVLIHDGARPLVTQKIIEDSILAAVEYKACAVGMPVKDTIKIVNEDQYAVRTPERRRVWQIQTPQAFSYMLLRKAYDLLMRDEKCQEGITDDAMVVETMLNVPVKLIEGSYSNMKVTTPEDMEIARVLRQ
ncbi:MAG: 2-C-methyl-D-erythritol 4-phosphate cytidylyltransferase [bacterium]|nr:2-C-methyl-D-erythritol 4-phosphate cytidylyltransferase [bacterium]